MGEVCRMRGSFCRLLADVTPGTAYFGRDLQTAMAILLTSRARLLAIPLVAVLLGCASRGRTCDCGSGCSSRSPLCSIADGLYHGTLADELMCCHTGCLSQARQPCICPRARCGPECYPCSECRLAPLGFIDSSKWQKPEPGPPPATFRPEMPPKFLAVPTHPVVSAVPPEAPEPQRGNVEVGFRKEYTIPAKD